MFGRDKRAVARWAAERGMDLTSCRRRWSFLGRQGVGLFEITWLESGRTRTGMVEVTGLLWRRVAVTTTGRGM
jgi:hypothetical protein